MANTIDIVPKIVETKTDEGGGNTSVVREFTPDVVTKLGGTLPWDTDTRQLQCGETVVDNNKDFNQRINYECVATKSQLTTLFQMRNSADTVRLISAAYSGPITFDELVWERISDSNGAVTAANGADEQPRYKVQLQSKEESG
jgi:hypothetical protein